MNFAKIYDSQSAPGPPRCISCGYLLQGLEEPRCPECGQRFDPANPRTYSLRPPFLRWHFWLPGILLALVGGTLLTAIALASGNLGWGLVLAIPFSVGGLLGYGFRASKWLLIFIAIGLAASVALGMISLSLAGIFCGIVLTVLFLIPIVCGAIAGVILRTLLKRSKFTQRWYLPALLFLLGPLGFIELEGHHHHQVESIQTTIILPVSIDRAFHSFQFYEQVQQEPPLILRVGLPRPLYATGHIHAVGDKTICVYTKGRLIKQATTFDPPRKLAFAVTEQFNIEDRSIRLTGGSFTFEPVTPTSTRVTLTTDYEPLLSPRWYWSPAERIAAHALHAHVLEGMRLESLKPLPVPTPQLSQGQP